MNRLLMKRWTAQAGLALTDVAIAIGVIAVLLAAITAAVGAIENARVNTAERSIDTLQGAATNWLSNGRFSYTGISIAALRTDQLLPTSFTEVATNPWGGDYQVAASGSGGRELTITLSNVPASAGQSLLRKFQQRARTASFTGEVFTATF